MKKTILLSLLLALVMTKAAAYDEVAGFDGPTWYEYTKNFPVEGDELRFDQVMDAIFEGDGSSEAPLLIKTPEQLAWIAYQVNVKGQHFKDMKFRLAADLDLNRKMDNQRVLWVPIGLNDNTHEFWGTIDNPDKHVIKDMLIKANSTETTTVFGLFGSLSTTITGFILENAEIVLTGLEENYFAGLLCGVLESEKRLEYWQDVEGHEYTIDLGIGTGIIDSCHVQGYVTACGNSKRPRVGGLTGRVSAGYRNYPPELSRSVVRLERMTLTGPGTIAAGGVVGDFTGEVLRDCHSVIGELTAEGLSQTDGQESYIGGVVGGCLSTVGIDQTIKFCTSSGEMTVTDNSKVYMGGVLGFNDFHVILMFSYNASAATLTGGHTVGGLIGFGNPRDRLGQVNGHLLVENSLYNGYINGENATYVGGLFGYLNFAKDATTNVLSNTSWNYFCGTMKKPSGPNTYYGVIMGYAVYIKNLNSLCHFEYDRCACDFQTNGQGQDLSSWIRWFDTPRPIDGEYSNYRRAVLHPTQAAGQEGKQLCFTDNYALCDIPFHITNDWKTYYRATDVTIDFTIDDFKNKSTGERVAVFTVPDNLECVRVDEKHIYPLDPGEVVASVKWNGLERKVHLDITYGKEWAGGRNTVFEGGDGTEANPYLIHNADQFHSATGSSMYNKADKYFKLANDIFFNTHLLQADGTPRADAVKWVPRDFKAHLDGNGKTIYGLCVTKDRLAEGETLGIFNNLYGTVKNLAIVDSNVSTDDASYADTSAGLLCGTMKEGASVSNCLLHGRVSADSYCGGIAAYVEDNTSITDCFTNVHLTWPEAGRYPQGAGGMCYQTPTTMQRCISTGRVEQFTWNYGLSKGSSPNDACYFDFQMQSGTRNSYIVQDDARSTDELVNGNLMKSFSTWQQVEDRYPMLNTFADTPYGRLLAIPVFFDREDDQDCYHAERAGDVNYIFEFPTEDVTWSALRGDTYIDVINDCGAASIVQESGDATEILIAEAVNVQSQCTRAMRTLALNLRSGLTSFKFKDSIAQSAAFAAFNKQAPSDILTLRELVEATPQDFDVFNANATGMKAFPEFRYFVTVTTVSEGMLSGLDQLNELQLPKKLLTLAERAFDGCTSLEEIKLPATFTTVEEGALFGSSIKNLLVSEKHPTMQSIDGVLFETDHDGHLRLLAYPQGRGEENATISVNMYEIAPNAFYRIPNLKNVYIDNCLPEGNLVLADYNSVIHEDDSDMMHIYVNDGSYDRRGNTDISLLYDQYVDDSVWGEYFDNDHLHIYYPLNVTSALWATLYIGFPTQLPEGLTAYIVTSADAETTHLVKLKNIGRVIPQTTPVVIKATETGVYPLTRHTGAVPDIRKYNNRLVGTYIGQEGGKFGIDTNQETAITGGVLTLGRNKQGVVGFYKYTGAQVPPYRAYLTANTLSDQSKDYVFFEIDDTIDEMPTAVSTVVDERGRADGAIYDLQGRRMNTSNLKSGIYIRNGKKIVVK